MDCASAHCSKAVCDCTFTVVVSVNSKREIHLLAHSLDNGENLIRHGSAVCVAKHQHPGAASDRGAQCLKSIGWIDLEGVKKVLGVVDHLPVFGFKVCQAVNNHGQILFQGGADYFVDMQDRRLADHGAVRGLCLEQGAQVFVIFRGRIRSAS